VAREPPLSHDHCKGFNALANPELGQKQICPTCQTKFYDLTRRPAVCPKCGATFDPEEALRNRRVRVRAPDYDDDDKPAAVKPDPEGFEDEADETPEIDKPEAADPIESDDEDASPDDVAKGPADDIGVDFAEDEEVEDTDDVPFLEEEDEEDFVDEEIDGLPEEGDENER
jgi:uncharacterized protein (TIGR02300 family)